jgi:hypothetical protein
MVDKLTLLFLSAELEMDDDDDEMNLEESVVNASGSVPVSIDLWKITVKLGAIWLAHSLRIRLGISSGSGNT